MKCGISMASDKIGNTTKGKVTIITVAKNCCSPEILFIAIKWLKRAENGLKSVPKIFLKKARIVNPTA